jgi:asparaginyl-tRNA synthetase
MLGIKRAINKSILVERVFEHMDKAIDNYFDREGFVKVRAPFMSEGIGSCENPKTLFGVDYLGKKTYLRQSAQLYLEMYMPALTKVWCEGPSFRAEQKKDHRHLSEFNLYEFEFCGNFEQLLILIENLFSEIIGHVHTHAEKQLLQLGVNIDELSSMKPPYPRVTYEKAVEVLGLEWGSDLRSEHEKALVKMYGFKPLFVMLFPKQMKFFNMKVKQEDDSVVNSVDLILPFSGEAVGGAEREFHYDAVKERLLESAMLRIFKDRGVDIDSFEPYLNHLKTEGSVLHSGCGIGIERVLQFLISSSNINDVMPLQFGSARSYPNG